MSESITTKIERMLTLATELKSGSLGSLDDDQKTFIGIVDDSLRKLHAENVLQYSLIGLSVKSHDLRQMLTSIVGYCALLNSPKLSNHGTLMRKQLLSIHELNDLARDIHWRLDGLIQFATQIVRPTKPTQQDMGMLNIGGYLRSQADHYVCRRMISEVAIPDSLPYVYANDTYSKLMLRGLFSIALDLADEPDIHVSAYTMRKFLRVKISIGKTAGHLDDLMKLLEVKNVRGRDARKTQAMLMSVGSIKTTTLVELGMYIATNLAAEQGGRVKLESDGDRLVFTLTMPAEVPETGKLTPLKPEATSSSATGD